MNDLREDQPLFRAVFESALDAFLLADDDARYVDANPAACALFGVTREQLLGRQVADFAEPGFDAAAAWRAFLGAGQASGRFRLVRPDGGVRDVDFRARADIAPGLHLSILRDVTEARRAEEELRDSRRLLESAQALANVGTWVSDTNGVGMRSAEHARICGTRADGPCTAEDYLRSVHPDDRDGALRRFAEAIERRDTYAHEYRIVRPDGAVRWVQSHATLVCADDGTPARIVGAIQDVTERRALLEELRASEQRYRRLLDAITNGVLLMDPDGRITLANEHMARMLKTTVDALAGESIFRFAEPDDHEAARERLARRRSGIGDRYVARMRRVDGTAFPVRVQTDPVRDKDGRVEGLVSIVEDLSAQHAAEEVRSRLAAIVEHSDDAILSTDLDGTILTWNGAAERLYRYSAGDVVGRNVALLVPAEHAGSEQELLKAVARGESVDRYETQRRRKDGTLVEVALSVSPVRDSAGRIIGASKLVRDLTEQRKAEVSLRRIEEQLRQSQKMEAIAALAGGVAHDFNNLLTVILSCGEAALEEVRAGDPLRQDIEDMVSAGKRATELTRQLLAFGRQQILDPRLLDLGRVVDGLKRVLARTLREDVELAIFAGSSLGKVFADPGQIEQILMNLVVNARDAMPGGGKLTIETSNVTLDEGYAAQHPGVKPGEYVMLAVTDTGTGMDEATKARIFEPFFTTKSKSSGSGLGLSTVFGIVHQSGGAIFVYSELGRGTTFKVYLPRSDRTEDSAAVAMGTQAGATLRGSETVLLVEDDEQVRRTVHGVLRRFGYNVLVATNGGEALLICEQHEATIHLLLTDVVMPRMSGRQLADRLVPLRPNMKVLFMSGYTDTAIVRHGVLDAGVSFLQKPVTPNALARKLREVIESSPRTG